MHQTEADLSPDERRREIASIFAAGILRLSTPGKLRPNLAGNGMRSFLAIPRALAG